MTFNFDTWSIIIAAVLCEALVHLWFHAAPIQGIRRFVIKMTPFLYSKEQETHMLDCPYCTSFYAGVVSMLAVWYSYITIVELSVCAIIAHRLSNFVHLAWSIVRDRQLDIRVNRRK